MTEALPNLRLVDEDPAAHAGPKPAKYPRDIVMAAALLFLPDDGTGWIALCEKAMHFYESNPLPIRDYAINEPSRIALTAFEMMPREYKENRHAWHGRLRSVAGDRFCKARGFHD